MISAGNDKAGFVVDGWDRARDAAEPEVRAAVIAEYADRWQEASFLARLALRFEIKREIARRLEQLAPAEALY